MTRLFTVLFSFILIVGCGNDQVMTVGNNGNANNGSDGGNNGSNNRDAGNNNTDTGNVRVDADVYAFDVNTSGFIDVRDTSDTTDLGPSPDPVATADFPIELAGNFQFTEGPRWLEAEGVLRFTDIPANTIFELTLPNQIVAFTDNSMGANGLAVAPNGDMLAAEHGGRVIVRYSGNTRSVLVPDLNGALFNSPNDIVVAENGMYFTDPPYGLNGRTREIAFNGLYFYNSALQTVESVWEGEMTTRPNGVVLSPDGKVLYLADTANNEVLQFNVMNDGTLDAGTTFLADVANPDGMAVDVYGNVYITQGGGTPGIRVLSGDALTDYGTIELPTAPANVAFGGPDADILFITARSQLFQVDMQVEGIY